MYQLTDPVLSIKGIGQNLNNALKEYRIEQLLDFLLFLPLRYEDRSFIQDIATIKSNVLNATLSEKDFVTCKAKLLKWKEYRKGRLLIGRASITDDSDQIDCLWFNNKFLKNKLIVNQEYFFSGKVKAGQLMQASVEKISEENIHTGRLVPIYPKLGTLKQGSLRRLLAEGIGRLNQAGEIENIFKSLHFPKTAEDVILARERLALEEIIYLMKKSALSKELHQKKQAKYKLEKVIKPNFELPFTLTNAQEKALQEILGDLAKNSPMNRLLVGDVGSGKTIVAAIPAILLVQAGQSVCLLAPTKILAKQHLEKLQSIFPKIPFSSVQAGQNFQISKQATFYIGTHSLLNKLEQIQPSLVIYDEQQRFGVKHRQLEEHLNKQVKQTHLLSMTATPIPRSLMLSIFSHLDLSYLDQMPNQRQMATTWLIPKHKESKSIQWLVNELIKPSVDENGKSRVKQALIVCPFINPSSYKATENVAAVENSVKNLNEELTKVYKKIEIPKNKQFKLAALHSKLNKKEQLKIIDQVYNQEIQILVSTPMIEVGVDLPNADIIFIQSAERFGLSSLHQLRGRVGRRGQESYCLLFRSNETDQDEGNKDRLQKFCEEKDGLKLATLDLENRGAGDLLGYKQSGLNTLHFASWTNAEIIQQAATNLAKNPHYQSFIAPYLEKIQTELVKNATN